MHILRRRIEIATRPGIARGNVEDNFHDFRVEVEHRDGVVVSVRGFAMRNPWTLCVSAAGQVSKLEGMPLSSRAAAVTDHTDRYLQCTHVLDLAGMCIAAAARDIPHRRYDIAVPQRVDGRTTATLAREESYALEWVVEDSLILSPDRYAGVDMRKGFGEWAAALEDDEAEAVHALRRAIFISGGIGKAWDSWTHAKPAGGCYVQQPERASDAVRVAGSLRNFTDKVDGPGAGNRAWLAFED